MKSDKEKDKQDVVLLHSPTEDGEGVRAVRSRPGRLDFTELRPLEEGKDVSHSEVIKLTPHEKTPRICDVDVIYGPEEKAETQSAQSHAGPARIASDAYRKNWDQVFKLRSKKPPKDTLLN